MSAPADTQVLSGSSLRGFLHGLPGVDEVGAEARAAMLASRSIKTTAKRWALDMAISMIDLTTLEGQDTPGKVRALCAKARRPDPADPTAPQVAAVCVYPDLAHLAAAEVKGTGIHVASVATAFPSGRTSLPVKLADAEFAIEAGADEVDMVIDRGAFLAGDYQLVFDEIAYRHLLPRNDPIGLVHRRGLRIDLFLRARQYQELLCMYPVWQGAQAPLTAQRQLCQRYCVCYRTDSCGRSAQSFIDMVSSETAEEP